MDLCLPQWTGSSLFIRKKSASQDWKCSVSCGISGIWSSPGGSLSPFIFVLYVSDLELWLKWSSAKIYADDTTTTTTAKNLEELIRRMEEDAATKKLHLIAPNKKGS